MYEAALKLGVSVVKAACGIWIGNPIAENAATTVVDLVQEKVTGRRDQRKLERKFAEIEESIADRVVGYLDHEFQGLAENEREAAVLAVADAFERAGLTDRVLFEQDLDPLYLERYVRARAPGATRDLSGQAVTLFDRVLPESCAYVMATLRTLPRFQAGAFSELLRRESLVLGKLDELLDRIPEAEGREGKGREEDAEAAFVTAYRRTAAERWDVLELFGTDARTQRYPLTLAYLSLRVSWHQEEQAWDPTLHADPALSGDLRVEQALASHRRTFLRGPAGTGKTTLMRWVGVRACRGDFPEAMSAWNGLTPFMVPLRQYVGEKLPEPADFVRHTGRHLADQAPVGWANRVLAEGRGIVLVDGVDELPQTQREAARRWLRDLMSDFPESRYVVTTRPGAAQETWLEADGFVSAELQPLTDDDVGSFIHHWHEAVRSEIADEAELERLDTYEHELTRKVLGQRHLRAIAATPLLCALLCALYRDRHTSLPRDRMEVYEAALAMLLKDRDQQRGIEGVELSRSELVLLLQELAKWLIINGSSDAPTATAQRQVTKVLRSMHRVTEEPGEVFTHLIVRSGLLQSPTVDRVSFLHRTFEEYLAAKAIVEEDSFPLLVSKAHDDQWHEVVVMAAGHATPTQREELVTGLLERADQVKKHHDRLLLVAFACLETSPQLAEHLREAVEKRVQSILPPRTKEHVHALGLVGESALQLLARTPAQNARQAAKIIEAASLIGGPASVPVIERCLPYRSEAVFLATRYAWQRAPSLELAKAALEEMLGTYRYAFPIATSDLHLLPRYVPRARVVMVEGTEGDEITPLSEMLRLTQVSLKVDSASPPWEIDLSPLSNLNKLEAFKNFGRTYISSIEPLPKNQIRDLSLSHPETVLDLQKLACFRNLEHLQLDHTLPPHSLNDLLPKLNRNLSLSFRFQNNAEYLEYLTTAPNSLNRITLISCRNPFNMRPLFSQKDSLASLSVVDDELQSFPPSILRGLPLLEELEIEDHHLENEDFAKAATELSALHRINLIHKTDHFIAPPWIRQIPHLRTLRIHGRGPVDLTSLAGMRDLTVEVAAFRSSTVTGAELLGEGSRVVRDAPYLFRPRAGAGTA
ncbi:NACHT domain-containing protein [Nocardiopsis sp. L17-MgMaSL7]|uniref:NACHT N-terminal Helical domain 1-containing protein n=1 Tax=Nocardiopsis sp. L17-MgMaSL7 TaxID=1938893 RepID=UPI000D711072|nr:NACHT domain-containing protein [Nocardiopsis sp. L17-MgMaSL7]PWV55199.1 NACHT domain-containing protein [Nocardiopsis sp. L17-MgMaSL7]